MDENIIYGIKVNDTYHYIGKTKSNKYKNGKINKSELSVAYNKPNLKPIFSNNPNITIEPLHFVDKWFDEKLAEVLIKYKNNHPLTNAQWMLDGKRGVMDGTDGFWKNKVRDIHTINRLAESKFKKIVQYDSDGNLVKLWDCAKHAAIDVFNDYVVKNGSGESRLYRLLENKTLKTKFKFNSYWFRESELLENFNTIPKKLHIDKIIENQNKLRYKNLRNHKDSFKLPSYTIIQYNDDNTIKKTYVNAKEAAYILKLREETVRRLCTGQYYNPDYNIKYGEKTLQSINIKYPDYKLIQFINYKSNSNRKYKHRETKQL